MITFLQSWASIQTQREQLFDNSVAINSPILIIIIILDFSQNDDDEDAYQVAISLLVYVKISLFEMTEN